MKELMIPSHFQNFKQRQLQMGIETCSTIDYKGYQIFMRAYYLSGIRYKIFKVGEDGKRVKLRERGVNFCNPLEFLNHAKNYIDTVLLITPKS